MTSTQAQERYLRDPAKVKAINERCRLNKYALIAAIKLGTGCVDCGYNEFPEALHFDHKPGAEKSGNIARMTSMSQERILAEIEKCEVRCANCHAHITAIRRNTPSVQE